MDSNKDSNLFSYIRNKYGDECVTLFRKLEITIKKMADYRNHRRFTLKCIKASVTPVSCKLKNSLKTRKSYDIIHKVEKQLLYERIRNINNILDMYEQTRCEQYSHLKNMLKEQDQHDQDIGKCIQFINRIKEQRHDKIKNKSVSLNIYISESMDTIIAL